MARNSGPVKPASQDLLHLTVLRTERLTPHWMRITLGGGAVYILKQSLQARARAGIHIHISVGLAAVAVANLHALGRGRLGGVCREPQ